MSKEFHDTVWPQDTVSAGVWGKTIEIESSRDSGTQWTFLTPSDARDFANQILVLVQDIETT